MNSNQKIALVTGAGSGIGKHTAFALWNAGYSVALAGRRVEALEATAKAAGVDASRILIVPTDVTDPASIRSTFAKVKETFGRLDVLFNNAGVGAPDVNLEDLTYEQWKRVVDTNLTGSFLCTQEAFKIMKDQKPRGGRIINNASVSAQVPRRQFRALHGNQTWYTGLTKSTSLDGRKYDIACSQIDIGNAAVERMTTDEKGMISAMQPYGEVASKPAMAVEDVADAVVYMANLPLDANVQFMTIMATKMLDRPRLIAQQRPAYREEKRVQRRLRTQSQEQAWRGHQRHFVGPEDHWCQQRQSSGRYGRERYSDNHRSWQQYRDAIALNRIVHGIPHLVHEPTV